MAKKFTQKGRLKRKDDQIAFKRGVFHVIILSIMISAKCIGQQGQWTWMKGDSTTNMPWSYGVQGVSSPTNLPMCTYEGIEWTDLQGRFWLFGGLCNIGGNNTTNLCDLWMFDPTTNNWTWVKGNASWNANGIYGTQGIPSPTNNPGSRGWGGSSWTDLSGNLWLFGGLGYPELGFPGTMADLWKYDITTNEWTWMKGPKYVGYSGSYGTMNVSSPTNQPPGRMECSATWVDNAGNLWLYGGQHIDSASTYYNLGDLWMYNIGTNEWTWKGGNTGFNTLPFYGTKGVPAAGNTPGARVVYSRWKDEYGNLWLFGGKRNNIASSYNDLWKFDPVTGLWTWISGSNIPGSPGNYGQACVSDTAYCPSSRVESRSCWTDKCGNFWLFGGSKNTNADFNNNDLWFYNPSINEWKLVNGTSAYNDPGNYGNTTVPSPTNQPSKRLGAHSWITPNGELWMFGGLSEINGLNWYFLNDMWRYVPDTACTGPQTGNGSVTISPINIFLCAGDSVLLTASGGNSYTWSPSSSLSSSTGTSVLAFPTAPTTYTVTSTGPLCHNTATVTISFTTVPTINASADVTICIGDTAQLSVTGSIQSYNWSPPQLLNTSNGNTVGAFPTSTTTFIVTGNSSCGQTVDTIVVSVDSLQTLSFIANQTICSGDTASLIVSGGSYYNWSPSAGLDTTFGCCVLASPVSTTTYSVTSTNACGSLSTATTVNILPLPVINFTGNTSICIGDSTQLTANGALAYNWLPNSSLNTLTGSNVIAVPNSTSTFVVTGTGSNGCSDSMHIQVNVHPLPQLNATSDMQLCYGEMAVLTVSGADYYSWTPALWLNNDTGSIVMASPQSSVSYLVSGYSLYNCFSVDTVEILVEDCDVNFSAPNIFTPNADGINDLFQITVDGVTTLHVMIYDRWGVLIFESTDIHFTWDGIVKTNNKPATDGTYYYVVEMTTPRKEKISRVGFFELIR